MSVLKRECEGGRRRRGSVRVWKRGSVESRRRGAYEGVGK